MCVRPTNYWRGSIVKTNELQIVPITLAEANAYVELFHRHNGELPSAKFAVGLIRLDGSVVGVAIAGLPKARGLMNRGCIEINRICTMGERNACSMLYAACIRAGRSLGYRRFVTYTLQSENGASLKATGWIAVSTWKGGKWSEMRGTGGDDHDTGPKVRWEIVTQETEIPRLIWPAEIDGNNGQETMNFDL